MPIPVGRSGNVDGEGGDKDGVVRPGSVADTGGLDDVSLDHRVRVGMESLRLQLSRSLRWSWTARALLMDDSSAVLLAAAMAPEPSVAELTNDADSDGTDGS